MSSSSWHLLTGEYPPRPGGISDYTQQVARELAWCGDEVHVWSTGSDEPTIEAPGLTVHRVVANWSPAELRALGGRLDAFPTPRRLLVQYTPGSWGFKTLNLAFGRWLSRRKAVGDDIWLMVHEAYYPIRFWDRPARWVLPWGHRLMMRDALGASSRAFVSTPLYETIIRTQEVGGRRPITWLPVPSNIPRVENPERVEALRRQLSPEGQSLVGSFGANAPIRPILAGALRQVLGGHPDRLALILGRDGPSFQRSLALREPDLAATLVTPGLLSAEETSLHIQACDLMLQPYPEGVSTRRGTMMAAMAHGSAIVTTRGKITEPIWEESACARLVPVEHPEKLAEEVEALLDDRVGRLTMGARAMAAYDRHFALENTVRTLRAQA